LVHFTSLCGSKYVMANDTLVFTLVHFTSLCGSKYVMANDTLVFTLVHFTSDKVSVILTVNLTDNKIYFYNIVSSTLHVTLFTSCL